MLPSDFTGQSPGRLARAAGTGGEYWAYVPNPLPPRFAISTETISLLAEANLALGELKGVGRMLPNPHLLIGPFLRQEAIASSRIEGTVTSFGELLLFESDPTDDEQTADRQEVVNYVRALEYGIKRLETYPVSLRVMREMHAILMEGVRGENKKPGEFRTRQNMIGREGQTPAQATFVPPPVAEMNDALHQLETSINQGKAYVSEPRSLPILIDLALIHYQFESIHPFEDGNGRIGRLLISLLLLERKCLTQPLLYLSAYLERHRDQYMAHLLSVSQKGDWSGWVDFFLLAVCVQSKAAVNTAGELLELWTSYRSKFQQVSNSSNLLKLIDLLFERPYVTVRGVAKALGVTFPTAQNNIDLLTAAEVLSEATGRSRNRVYVARPIVELIEKSSESETSND